MPQIHWLKADITQLKVDAIVNAANSSLRGGGGVDGAIHRAAGKTLLKECLRERAPIGGPLPAGQAVITAAGKMPSRFVVHTVGPVYDGSRPKEMERLLADCYRNSMRLAEANGCRSIAFSNISTGVYGFPKAAAADTAIGAVNATLPETPCLEAVYFVCFDAENAGLYRERLGEPAPQSFLDWPARRFLLSLRPRKHPLFHL